MTQEKTIPTTAGEWFMDQPDQYRARKTLDAEWQRFIEDDQFALKTLYEATIVEHGIERLVKLVEVEERFNAHFCERLQAGHI